MSTPDFPLRPAPRRTVKVEALLESHPHAFDAEGDAR